MKRVHCKKLLFCAGISEAKDRKEGIISILYFMVKHIGKIYFNLIVKIVEKFTK